MMAEGLGRGVAHLTMAVVMVATQYGTAIGEHTIALISSRMAYKVANWSSCIDNPTALPRNEMPWTCLPIPSRTLQPGQRKGKGRWTGRRRESPPTKPVTMNPGKQ